MEEDGLPHENHCYSAVVHGRQQPDVPTVCRILQMYHSHVECARAHYKLRPRAPHDSLEPRIPAVGTNMLYSLPPVVPGRSNAGVVEECLNKFEENEMRVHHEHELMVRCLLRKAPGMVELWRGARFSAVADAETEKRSFGPPFDTTTLNSQVGCCVGGTCRELRDLVDKKFGKLLDGSIISLQNGGLFCRR
ncbi:hypothetical protein SLS58_009209 [Diplodia intermedia]|uniref:Uncharacterized protein n=1 Tax=Diplodia intermedia TaxID=856260 RepID=A0ABR3TEK0_9PEZI